MRPGRGMRAATALALLFAFAALLAGAPALAHYPWITVHEGEDESESFRISFGHTFPEAGLLRVDRLDGVRVVQPDGGVEALELEEREYHPLPDATEGAVMIVAEQKPAYWSRTHEGGRRASREAYPDAFSCSQSANSMKAVAGHGTGAAWQHRQGHALEVVPLVDPAGLRFGDPLSVQVLLHGEPWVGDVRATHAGHSRDGGHDYALTVRTDADGVARMVPAVSGYWLVQVHASEEYPDPAVCDRRSYNATLTFTVR
ncbi:MAG: DUF4198 domain-containing protein [Thioalkalivibrio sp.]|nr:MAG: DUF4198 domain-containing protein [Thioalkalivibrio sp.]